VTAIEGPYLRFARLLPEGLRTLAHLGANERTLAHLGANE